MTVCTEPLRVQFEGQTKPIDLAFDAPYLSSDGGFLLLAQLDDTLGICERLAASFPDPRDQAKVKHSRFEQIRQRLFQIVMGYEDCNDAQRLRHDPLLKTVCGQSHLSNDALSSQPTLCRLENSVDAWDWYDLVLDFEQYYVDSLDGTEQAIILDIDTSDDPTHGEQQLSFFHAYYGGYIYHPTFVFDQHGRLVTAVLKPGNTHASKRAGTILERIIRRIRNKCPHAAIMVRADSGFSVPKVHERLDRLDAELGDIDYLLGQATNEVLKKLAQPSMDWAQREFERTGEKVRECFDFPYAAKSWEKERRVILKAEYTQKGPNPRFLVTSLDGWEPVDWYDGYCQRGQAENHIKGLMNAMFADRLSCSSFVVNASRLLLYGWAYRLMWALREKVKEVQSEERAQEHRVPVTPWQKTRTEETEDVGRWQFDSLRSRLLKVAAVVKETCRRIWVRLPEYFPLRELFVRLLRQTKVAELTA